MYSISTVSNSKNLDLTVTSEGCANSCDVGDSIVQTGELTIYEEFDEQICVNLVLTMSFGSTTSTGSGDLCEVFNVKSVDGSSECPAPGDYTFSTNMTVTSLTNGTLLYLISLLTLQQTANLVCISRFLVFCEGISVLMR